MDVTIHCAVNGKSHAVTTDDKRPLLDVLREDLHLTGTRYGCGEGQCGACSVLVDGKRVFSCNTPAARMDGKQITTIEGLAKGETLHPVQQAFLEEGAFQCAYCTSGMIMAAAALLNEKPNPTDADIRAGMNGNICRCCTYVRIENAVRRAAKTATAANAGGR
ncbi:MAG TPA: (2Fe-2S)-binding protein [Tepidisphaeraceae bacterium]|jgi:aerobic-type carbon monoxide dehydrogenase small subunit (CoxS/CutS family)